MTASDGNGGTATATVTITINDPRRAPLAPGQPIAVAVPRTYRQISVRWFPPENSGRPEITGYDVQYEDYDPETSALSGWTGPRTSTGHPPSSPTYFHSAGYVVRVARQEQRRRRPLVTG